MTGNELKIRRMALGMSRHQLAAALGLAYRTIQDWELGRASSLRDDGRMLALALEALAARDKPPKSVSTPLADRAPLC